VGAGRRLVAAIAGAWLLFGWVLYPTAGSALGASGRVMVVASIDGQAFSGSSTARPVRLTPTRVNTIELRVTNQTRVAVQVGTVQLEGRVAGLVFFDYDTLVDLQVAAGESATLAYQLNLSGLRRQATGLIPSSLRLLDGNGHPIAAQTLVADVEGSIFSVYGLFGVALVVLTGLGLVDALVAVARHKLSPRRWRRAVRFLGPGVGAGLVLVFTLSALRVWVPDGAHWLITVVVCGLAACAVGLVSPTPVMPVVMRAEEVAAPNEDTRVTIVGDP
jgi:hypothetical protein